MVIEYAREKLLIIFNYNIRFIDELQLDNGSFSNDLKTVHIKENAENLSSIEFPLRTGWIELSGQEVRYHSSVPFHDAKEVFSWGLEVKDVVTLIWNVQKREILYLKGKNYRADRLRYWVFHTFFPLVLELEKKYRILHVGSVEIYGKPILFSAASFGGKSTMTDYFIQKGHTMLSDDSPTNVEMTTMLLLPTLFTDHTVNLKYLATP